MAERASAVITIGPGGHTVFVPVTQATASRASDESSSPSEAVILFRDIWVDPISPESALSRRSRTLRLACSARLRCTHLVCLSHTYDSGARLCLRHLVNDDPDVTRRKSPSWRETSAWKPGKRSQQIEIYTGSRKETSSVISEKMGIFQDPGMDDSQDSSSSRPQKAKFMWWIGEEGRARLNGD